MPNPLDIDILRRATCAQIDQLFALITEDLAPCHGEQFLAFADLLDEISRALPPPARQPMHLTLAMEDNRIAPHLIARLALAALLQVQLARAEKELEEQQ
jgi:hypothetical protein